MKCPILIAAVLHLFLVSSARSDELEAGIKALSGKLVPALTGSENKRISVSDFTDLQGEVSELGRYVAEQLSVELVNGAKGLSMLDRAHLKSLLDEHKLTAQGLVNPSVAKRVGQFAGVDVIVLGSISTFPNRIVLTARAIETESSRVVAVATASLSRSGETDSLMTARAGKPPQPSSSPSRDFTAGTSRFESADVVVEVESFRVLQQSATVRLKVTAKKGRQDLKLALNRESQGLKAFLQDDAGRESRASAVSGLNRLDHPNGFSAYSEDLASSYSNIRERAKAGIEGQTDLSASEPVFVTLRFPGGRAAESYRLDAEFVVIARAKSSFALKLFNLSVPDLRPAK